MRKNVKQYVSYYLWFDSQYKNIFFKFAFSALCFQNELIYSRRASALTNN